MAIAVLLSGGVDSAVATLRLIEQGKDLHLFYIRIGRDDGSDGCSAEEDIEMCQLIARRYHLPLDIVPLHREYWDTVMAYALDAVKKGLTPNPDVMCNAMIKFGCFEQRHGHEFEATATGHYAAIKEINGLKYLATAPDLVKDQTDFLARLSYDQLAHAMFPLGDLEKPQVRALALKANLPNALRRDSQGICFLGKIDYNEFLRLHLGEKPGKIVELETGKILGQHRGYWFHTIGQRKGLGLSGGPWYVVKKDITDNVIYVSCGFDTPKQYGTRVSLCDTRWLTRDPWPERCVKQPISFKNRHTPQFIEAQLTRLDTGEYLVEAHEPIQGIAAGQFGVIYSPDRTLCLGSGIINNPLS